jgi:hypothetical protein
MGVRVSKIVITTSRSMLERIMQRLRKETREESNAVQKKAVRARLKDSSCKLAHQVHSSCSLLQFK